MDGIEHWQLLQDWDKRYEAATGERSPFSAETLVDTGYMKRTMADIRHMSRLLKAGVISADEYRDCILRNDRPKS